MIKQQFTKPSGVALAVAIAVGSMTATVASAKESKKVAERSLEVIQVTAQKRSQSLQDVPIAISAVSGEQITDSQMHNLQDMSFSIPNVTISEAPFDNNLFIRGIGSGVNAGFEKSVGMYFDGVYAGKGQLSRSPFMDIERVEVLKGPQGILFGKNTIGGAITLTTADPTEDFEGFVDAYYDPEHNDLDVTTVVSGSLADNLQGRVALNWRDSDGFFENIFTGEDVRQRKNTVARVKLNWQPSDDLEVKLKLEHATFDDVGRQKVITHAGPGSAFASIVSDSKTVSGSQPGFEEFNNTETDVALIRLDYQLGDHTLTSITSYSAYEALIGDDVMNTRGRTDTELGPFAFYVSTTEDYSQVSEELRLLSPGGETFDYIIGAYLETSDFVRSDPAQWPFPAPGGGQTMQEKVYDQTTDSKAVFAQGTWNIVDDFRVTVGGRYTTETKELDFTNDVSTVLPAAVVGSISVLGAERKDSKFTWTANAQWDVNEDSMLYATASTGFKSGGYDNSQNASFGPGVDGAEQLAFEPETVDSIELGAKLSLDDGAAELNIAIFRSEYVDLQTSAFDGVASFVVGNAGESVTQGIEMDGRWLISEDITLTGALSFLDATYENFENAGCSQFHGKFTNECFALVDGVRDYDADKKPLIDFSGKPLVFAPDVSGTLGIEHLTEFNNGLELRTNLSVMYTDSFFTVQDLDPITEVDGYTKVNFRIALSSDDGGWQVALVANNIFDKQTLSYNNDITVGGLPGRGNTYRGLLDPPRTVGIQGRYAF